MKKTKLKLVSSSRIKRNSKICTHLHLYVSEDHICEVECADCKAKFCAGEILLRIAREEADSKKRTTLSETNNG